MAPWTQYGNAVLTGGRAWVAATAGVHRALAEQATLRALAQVGGGAQCTSVVGI